MTITASTLLQLKAGKFRVCHHKTEHGDCLSFSFGDLKKKIPIVRIHSACLFGEAFSSMHCDCGAQLEKTLELIKKNKSGALVYAFSEGRGHGLENKIKAMELERMHKIDSAEAMRKLSLNSDIRIYEAEIQALQDLEINKKIKVASGNPEKIKTLENAGYKITKIVKLKIPLNKHNKKEVTRKKKSGYFY